MKLLTWLVQKTCEWIVYAVVVMAGIATLVFCIPLLIWEIARRGEEPRTRAGYEKPWL